MGSSPLDVPWDSGCGRVLGRLPPMLMAAALLAAACVVPPAAPPDDPSRPRTDAGVDDPPEDAGPEDAGPNGLACLPGARGSTSVTEGETLDVAVVCTTGLSSVRLTLDPLPSGASTTVVNGELHVVWPTDLDDAQVKDVLVQAPDLDETGVVHLAVADRSLDASNVPPVDPASYSEELGLPVIFLSEVPAAEEYQPVDVVAGGHAYLGASAKLRGASSLGYPKKSITVKLDMNDRFEAPRLGFSHRKKIVLISTFDDNAYVRQRLAYQLYNRTQPGAPHTLLESASVVLYVGGEYLGLYTLADHVDRDLFEETLGLGDSGNLYKSIDHNANFRRERFPRGSGDKSFLGAGWELRDVPELPVGQWDDLTELVAFATDADPGAFDAGLNARFLVDDVATWWIFATAIVGEDSYGKNAYLYKESASSPFRYAPWDFNHSFGQAWETSRTDPTTPIDEGWPIDTNQLWERLLLSPQHGPALRAAYREALAGALSVDVVLALFNDMIAEVDAGARKDEAVWGQAYRDYYPRGDLQDFDGEVAYARAWIVERWAYLGEQ